MTNLTRFNSVFLGTCFILGLSSLGYLLGEAAIRYKEYERQVTVKGLSEREYKADVIIWPIQFTVADNSLSALYQTIDLNTDKIRDYLEAEGVNSDEITFSAPSIIDKSAQQYGGQTQALFRYTATQTVTVYSNNIDAVRRTMGGISALGKQGIVFNGNDY